jgi:hypothetical protein
MCSRLQSKLTELGWAISFHKTSAIAARPVIKITVVVKGSRLVQVK